MKKLATLTAAAALMLGLAMSIGTSPALAGGTSDSTGAGSHCYMFFFLDLTPGPDLFAQAMMNDTSPGVVIIKSNEMIEKYVTELGFVLTHDVGNVLHSYVDTAGTNHPNFC